MYHTVVTEHEPCSESSLIRTTETTSAPLHFARGLLLLFEVSVVVNAVPRSGSTASFDENLGGSSYHGSFRGDRDRARFEPLKEPRPRLRARRTRRPPSTEKRKNGGGRKRGKITERFSRLYIIGKRRRLFFSKTNVIIL